MPSCDYIEWYNRQPLWLRVLLAPILVAEMLVHSMAVMAFFVFVSLPFHLVRGWINGRRFWRTLRERGQVGQWSEAERRVTSGSGTLIVEMEPKGPSYSWLIDVPRDAVDPERIMPSWQQFKDQGWDVLESQPAFESMNRWTVERLGAYESSARALVLSWKQLDRLGSEAKQRSVLVVLDCCEGCLSHRMQAAGRFRRRPLRSEVG